MTQSSESPSLALPGVVFVDPHGGVVQSGVAAGWITPKGIRQWSQELSLIARADLSDALRDELGLTLPENRIAKGRHPLAYRAAQSLPLMAVTSDIAPRLVEKGVRVHTVGFDRVTGGFMYFAKGGKGEALEIHGDLLEIIAPTLETGGASNEDIEKHLDRFIDRLLIHFSDGLLDETRVELANALPRLATDARGLQGVDLDAFEAEAAANETKGKKHEDGAKKLVSALDGANGTPAKVPLFGEAKKTTQPAMDVMVGGKKTSLPARALWVVSGEPKAEAAVVAATPKAETPKPAAAKTPTPAVGTPKPAAAKTPTPAIGTPKPAVASPKPGAVSPKPAPVEAKAPSPKPAPVEIKPIVAAPVVSVGAPAAPAESKPAQPGTQLGLGVVPLPAQLEPVEEKPAPVEAKPEPVVEKKPEPVVEAKPEPVVEKKPEPVVEKKPEPEKKVEAKPKAEDKPAAKAERPIEKAEKEAPPPEAPKSNAMLFVIIAIVIIAAIAFFVMKKH